MKIIPTTREHALADGRPDATRDVDAVVLTHGHSDHVGYLLARHAFAAWAGEGL